MGPGSRLSVTMAGAEFRADYVVDPRVKGCRFGETLDREQTGTHRWCRNQGTETMNRGQYWVACCLSVVVLGGSTVGALTLVEGGASSHVIYLAADAPGSVRRGARDLKQYLQRVAGVDVPIVHEPAARMIALGDTPAAREAGIDVNALPWEGYRIVTRGSSLFVAGRDTGKDDRTPGGGVSNGTRNGVSTFLEQFLGVRWLMPGEGGD